VRYYYEGSQIFVDTATQNEGWAQLFPEHREGLIACGSINTNDRPATRDLYTPEQEQWVRDSDGPLMESLGYSSVGEPSSVQVGEFPPLI